MMEKQTDGSNSDAVRTFTCSILANETFTLQVNIRYYKKL